MAIAISQGSHEYNVPGLMGQDDKVTNLSFVFPLCTGADNINGFNNMYGILTKTLSYSNASPDKIIWIEIYNSGICTAIIIIMTAWAVISQCFKQRNNTWELAALLMAAINDLKNCSEGIAS